MKTLLSLPFFLGTSFNAFALDSYDPIKNELLIPKVQVGSTFYKDVKIIVGTVVSIDALKPLKHLMFMTHPKINY